MTVAPALVEIHDYRGPYPVDDRTKVVFCKIVPTGDYIVDPGIPLLPELERAFGWKEIYQVVPLNYRSDATQGAYAEYEHADGGLHIFTMVDTTTELGAISTVGLDFQLMIFGR